MYFDLHEAEHKKVSEVDAFTVTAYVLKWCVNPYT